MKKIKLILILALGFLSLNSCETTDLDLLDNPNALNPTQADIDLYMNTIQIRTATVTNTLGNTGAAMTRIHYMFGRSYENVYSPATFSTVWSTAYAGVLNDIKEMKILIDDIGEGYEKHSAVAEVIEAYLLITLVDYFGDIPYSEALDIDILNPSVDGGASVYAAALSLLDSAISKFQVSGSVAMANDFFYDNNYEKWIRLANTLKMKVYIQTRLVDNGAIANFEAIASSGNYIGAGEDWVFNWGSNIDNPNSRHPFYNNSYGPGGVPVIGLYQSNWFMDLMKNDKPIQDPRMRYYFYRQVNDVSSNVNEAGDQLRCTIEPIPPHYDAIGAVYCIIDNDQGYWGRDHGSSDGIPPDGDLRTIYGIYPVGGRFDDNSFQHINGLNYGAEGNGITPILLASTVDFWRAEASLYGGSGVTATHVANGISKSFNLVRSFANRSVNDFNASFIPDPSVDADYIAIVSNRVASAGTNADKLDLIAKELFITLLGNGTDAYNFYRRTGAPRDIQPNIEPNPGPFIRSHWYPANEVTANSSLNQKPNVSVKVFWDNNPDSSGTPGSGFPNNN